MDTREAMAAKLRDAAQAINPMHRGETWAQCAPEVQARWLATADVALAAERAAYLRGFAEAREMAVKWCEGKQAAYERMTALVIDDGWSGIPERTKANIYKDAARHIRAMKPEGE